MSNKLEKNTFMLKDGPGGFKTYEASQLIAQVSSGNITKESKVFYKTKWIPICEHPHLSHDIKIQIDPELKDIIPDHSEALEQRPSSDNVQKQLSQMSVVLEGVVKKLDRLEDKSPSDSLGLTREQETDIIQKLESLTQSNHDFLSVISTKLAASQSDESNDTSEKIINYLKSIHKKVESSQTQSDEYKAMYQAQCLKFDNLQLENNLLRQKFIKFRKKAIHRIKLLEAELQELGNESKIEETKPVIKDEVSLNEPKPQVPAKQEQTQSSKLENEDFTLESLKKGKTFEFENSSKWLIDTGSGVNGPFRFDEIVAKINDLTVDEKTHIRKRGSHSWRQLRDVLEFNAKHELKYEDPNDPQKNIYVIERTEYRIATNQIIRFEVGQKEFRGYLTNISLSGGYIEVTKFDESLEVDKTGVLYIDAGDFSDSVVADFIIKRCSLSKPRGFGFSFTESNEKNIETIGSFLLKSLQSEKIAA